MTKKILCLFFFLLFLFSCKNTFSQPGFQRLYGGVNQEISFVALPCPSGGIYFMGATTSTGSGDVDVVLMKVDNNGQVLWTRVIGNTGYDAANAMTLATDGSLVCAGSTKSFNGNSWDDLYFFKTDTLGNIQWSKTYSTSDIDLASAIIRTSDGGFAMTGFTRETGLKRVLLIRADSNGDTLFVRKYGGASHDQGVELCQTPDGGFMITGKTFSQTLGESDILLMRTDAQGNLLWTKSFGEIHWDEGAGVIHLQDGNYLVSGSTISFGSGDFDILLMKVDTSGNIIWGKTYGGTKSDASYTARQNADGSIVVSGYSNSMGYGHSLRMAEGGSGIENFHEHDFNFLSHDRGDDSTNIFLMKTTANGDTLWTRSYGDGAQDEGFHFSKMPDGGYVIPAFSSSFTNTTDSTQMLLIRTDSLGHSGCHEQSSRPMIDTTNFITQNLVFAQTGGMTENIVTTNSLVWNLNAEDACLYLHVSENREEDVEVFPNPASGELKIKNEELKIEKIQIVNLLGECILTIQPEIQNPKSEMSVDIQALVSGFYFLKLTTSSSEVIKKIIIQKK